MSGCVGVCRGVSGRCWAGVGCGDVGGCVGWWCWGRAREKVSLAPLYFPDTLVNPDTCLGTEIRIYHHFESFEIVNCNLSLGNSYLVIKILQQQSYLTRQFST